MTDRDQLPTYEVEHTKVSAAEWELLIAANKQHSDHPIDEKRNKQPPVPVNYESLLTDQQRESIETLINYGWEIMFIRRAHPDFIITICHFPETGETSLIEKDGTINSSHGLKIRP